MSQKSCRKLQEEFEKIAHDFAESEDPREKKKLLRRFRQLIAESDKMLLNDLPIESYQRLIDRHNRG